MKRADHTAAAAATDAPRASSTYGGFAEQEPANDSSMCRVIRIDQWELAAWSNAGDEEPRIRDVALGERLGYARPKDIRLIARDHERAGNINPFHVRAAVARTGAAPRTEDEMWFTEEEALFLATKSATPASIALTKEMIHVFVLARRGLLPRQQAPVITAETIAAIVAPLVAQSIALALTPILARISAIETHLGGPLVTSGTLSPAVASSIKHRLREAAKVVVGCGRAKNVRSARCKLEQRLRGAVKWAGAGCRIDNMPVSMESSVLREVEMIERETAAVAAALRAQRQMRLDEAKVSQPN